MSDITKAESEEIQWKYELRELVNRRFPGIDSFEFIIHVKEKING